MWFGGWFTYSEGSMADKKHGDKDSLKAKTLSPKNAKDAGSVKGGMRPRGGRNSDDTVASICATTKTEACCGG